MSISLVDALRQIDTSTSSRYLPIPIGEDQDTQELVFQSFTKDYSASYPPGATSNYFVSSGNIENTGALSFIKTIMLSLMYYLSPDDLKFLIIDSSNDFLEFAETECLFRPIAKNLVAAKELYALYEEERKRRFDIVAEQRDGLNSIYPLIQSKKVTDAPLLVLIDNDFDINYADSPNLLQNFYTKHFVRNDGLRANMSIICNSHSTIDPLILPYFTKRFIFRHPNSELSKELLGDSAATKLASPGDFIFYAPELEIKNRYLAPNCEEMLNQMQFINGITKGKYQLNSTVKLDDGRVVGIGENGDGGGYVVEMINGRWTFPHGPIYGADFYEGSPIDI